MAGRKPGKGSKNKRERINRQNPREDKRGGRKSIIRGKNTFRKIHSLQSTEKRSFTKIGAIERKIQRVKNKIEQTKA